MMFSESHNDRRHADHLRDRDNAPGIGDNSTKIGDDAAGIVDIAAKVMLRSILNGDCSNSVHGRRFPKGRLEPHSPRSLRCSAAARSAMPIVARLTRHRKILLNIV